MLRRSGLSCYPRELFPRKDCQGTSRQPLADSFEEMAMEKALSELAPHGVCPETRTHFHKKWAIPGREGVERQTLYRQFHQPEGEEFFNHKNCTLSQFI